MRSTLASRIFMLAEEYPDPAVDFCSLEGWLMELDEDATCSIGGFWDATLFSRGWGLTKILGIVLLYLYAQELLLSDIANTTRKNRYCNGRSPLQKAKIL